MSSDEPQERKLLGRPTKYKEEYAQMLIDHMELGLSFESFAGKKEVRVDRDTLYHWCEIHPDFSDAKRIGRAAQLMTDETTLTNLGNGTIEKGSASALIFKMKNCHGWTDKTEVAQTTTAMTLEEFIKQQNENKNE